MLRFARTGWLLLAVLAARGALGAEPVVIGAVIAQSGILADLAADLRKGLLLWQQEANAAGGLLGRRVELRLLDDRSESGVVRSLYEQLIRDEHAEVLVGPFGSAATLAAAAAAEANRRVLLNATGAARATQRPNARYVFQIPPPYGAYGSGVLEIARQAGYRRIMILARNDPVAREMAEAAKDEASLQGLQVVGSEVYGSGSGEFAAVIARAKAAGAQTWIAFGLPQDAVEMVKAFRGLRYAPALFAAQGAADPLFVKRVGQDAEFALGIASWTAAAGTRGNAQFVQAFERQWSAQPGLVAAEGYAAGKVLEEAARRAGSLETEALRAALSALRTETPLGPYAVDSSGAQRGARPMVMQILRGHREIVWPGALATAKWRLPYPRWEERRVIK